MCLNKASEKKVAKDTVMYKVFIERNGKLVSPFEYEPLTDDMIAGTVPYAARRVERDDYYERRTECNRKITSGFVHGYADKRSALNDLYMFYARNFDSCLIAKCRIPDGEAYYDGIFDQDCDAHVRATRAVFVERVEEMFCTKLAMEDRAKYGRLHVFAVKGKTPAECVKEFHAIRMKAYGASQTATAETLEWQEAENEPDMFAQENSRKQ